MRRFATLSRQGDFARLRRRGRRIATKNLVIYRSEPLPGDRSSLVGITVSKSIGKAVTRNKLRRRLSAIVHDALAAHRAMRLLFVARPEAAMRPFAALHAEVVAALERS
jgi:ribonuclease P protein component